MDELIEEYASLLLTIDEIAMLVNVDAAELRLMLSTL